MSVEAPFRILSFRVVPVKESRGRARVQSHIELWDKERHHRFRVLSDYPIDQVDPDAAIDGTDTQELVPRPYEGLTAARGRHRLRRLRERSKGTEPTTGRYRLIPRARVLRANDSKFHLTNGDVDINN